MSDQPNRSLPNRSLQAKSNARLAAVQLLYQAGVTGVASDPEKLASQYSEFLEDNAGNPKEAHLSAVPPDKAYLKKLLRGVTDHADRLEPMVDRVITDDWKKDRVSPLLLAILRCAAFELAEGKPAAAIVDEYVTLTGRFFGDGETGFVHAALHALSRQLQGAPPSND